MNENYSEYMTAGADIACLCPHLGGGICMIFCFLSGISHVADTHVSLVYGSIVAFFIKRDDVPFYLGGIEADSPIEREGGLRAAFVNRATPVITVFPYLAEAVLVVPEAYVTAEE